MASTYSALKIELIGTGEQSGTWGTTTNNNLGNDALGEAITGSADVTFASADVTVTLTDTNASQTARNLRLNLTGTTGGARSLILGSGCQIEKLYLINNTCADAITVKNTSGTGIAVAAGKSMFVYNNGTNVVEAVTQFNGTIALASGVSGVLPIANGGTGTSSTTFTNLATNVTGTLPIGNGGTGSTSTTFVNAATNVTGTLPIANGGTGSTSTTFVNAATNITGTLPIANGGTGTTSTTFTNLTTNVTGTLPVANGGTGLAALGTANQVLAVNAGATALEFQTASGGQLKTEVFTAPGTFTKPAACSFVQVRVVGAGGGGGGGQNSSGQSGGSGGYAFVSNIPVSAPVAITIGTGGSGGNDFPNPGNPGGTTSFGPGVSCTGGGGGTHQTPGSGSTGSATVSIGTAMNISPIQTFTSFSGSTANGANDTAIGGSINALKVGNGVGPGQTYSVPSRFVAGAGGTGNTAAGGGGGTRQGSGGVSGVVIVEYVG